MAQSILEFQLKANDFPNKCFDQKNHILRYDVSITKVIFNWKSGGKHL